MELCLAPDYFELETFTDIDSMHWNNSDEEDTTNL
jgi:hypothetical protein